MKKLLSILTALCLLAALTITASADHFTGQEGWHVAFTANETMQSNFRTADYNDPVDGLQPGDDIVFEVSLVNEHAETTDWYMTNEVLHSLEDRSANAATGGGAYTYVLTYVNVDGVERILFSSDTVGGEIISAAGEGLHEATGALKDYFYLDTLASGQTGRILLRVALDGETQGNDYQNTLADLQMNFGVELDKGTTTIVVTGDRTNLLPYFIAMGVSGILLLILAIDSVRRRKKRRGQAA